MARKSWYVPKVPRKIWIDATKKKPATWDLVVVKDDHDIEQAAWWTGNCWDWGKQHVSGKIVAWRRRCEQITDRTFDLTR